MILGIRRIFSFSLAGFLEFYLKLLGNFLDKSFTIRCYQIPEIRRSENP